MHSKNLPARWFQRGAILAALAAGILFAPALRAQPAEPSEPGRYLFIFDTSSGMKPRVDALEKNLTILLATSLSGQLHAGDSIGVWTIGQTLHPGDYPLQTWDPDRAVVIASNLLKFVTGQRYTKTADYKALQPLLNRVVKGSERLTIMIFCDGGTKLAGTPYDDDVNGLFDQKKAEQKNERQPFIVMLRSQRGQFVGGSVTASPQPLIFPKFPPLLQPPPPTPPPPPPVKKTNAPPSIPVAPAVIAPPLIIVGTKVGTNVDMLTHAAAPEAKPVIPEPVTPEPAPVAPAPEPVPVPKPNELAPPEPPVPPVKMAEPTPAAVETNPVVTEIPAAPPTNSPAPVSAPPSPTVAIQKKYLVIGAGLLVIAVIWQGLGIRRRKRANRINSLISRSMNDR